jgi:hypothetical protein
MPILNPFTFHRAELADSYCDSLEGKGLVDSRSGLFLAAPRRTGKSTFLREDLLPAMQRRGWTTVYVDLWADRSKDPALLINQAIKARLDTLAGVIAKLAKATGLEKINVFGALSVNVAALGLPEGVTISDALEALAVASQTPVALAVDEAQHALTTEPGINAMFALKAARDHLNQGVDKPRLFLVLTGSNRDKLAHFVLKRTQPFFGSNITQFPLLGKAFTDPFNVYINRHLAADNQFMPDDMYEAFKLVGHRPEILRSLVADLALDAGAAQLGKDLRSGAEGIKSHMWSVMESEFSELPVTQRAVLEVMIEHGQAFVPFSERAKQSYNAKVPDKTISTAAVQAALDSLREKGLIWRAAYGDYALEDASLAHWYKTRRSD